MINITKYIEVQRKEYHKIICIRAVIFMNQKVFFTKSGFKHLTRKGSAHRSVPEIIRRFNLLKHATDILQDYETEVQYRLFENNAHIKHFWGIAKIINGVKIKIIIRKIDNNGKLTFLSIMNNGKEK